MKYEVVIKTDLADMPKEHELSAALILAAHFKTNVVFLRPGPRKTADVYIRGKTWEIKSPRGNGKRTIDNNLRAARKQSQNIILDLRNIKLHQQKAFSHIRFYLSAGPHGFRKVLIITKSGTIVEIL